MKRSSLALPLLLSLALSTPVLAQGGGSFSFEDDQAPKDAVIPAVVPVIFSVAAPGDAPMILRTTTLLNNVWFDAIAPYSDTAVGINSTVDRRPSAERTDTNRNIAIFYASKQMLDSLYPTYGENWRQMLLDVGLDPDDESVDPTTAIGIGNLTGQAVVDVREHDGMNQLGDELGKKLIDRSDVGRPYSDYTGYMPRNTPYRLQDAGRWQPSIIDNGYGIFRTQQFITPQYAKVLPYCFDSPTEFDAPPPLASNPKRFKKYKAQVDAVLEASANMTDRQKMIAELFDNKISSLGFSALFVSVSQGMSLETFVHYDFLTNLAAFDTGIAIWHQKVRWDAVRPFSAIRHVYRDKLVTAWGGPGQGTMEIPANRWRSYLPVADHPEYPSASAAFCAAHAQSSRLFLGTDSLGWSFPVPAGSSVIEPGFTPQADLTLSWDTWSDFEDECGMSRFWAGVHFPAAIPAGQAIGTEIGTRAYYYIMSYIEGNPF